MEIQEVTLNIPLQYKAVQYLEGHFDELREWVEKESLGILQVMFTRSKLQGNRLCIFMIHRGTNVCLLRLRIGYCYLLRPHMGYIRLIMW